LAGPAAAEFGHHGREDGKQFSAFPIEPVLRFGPNPAIVPQRLNPELGLVGFLKQAVELAAELGV
jgi:hypothetical protein